MAALLVTVVLVILLLLRRSMLTWSLRLFGWLVLLPCAAVAGDVLGQDGAGLLRGNGGSVGV